MSRGVADVPDRHSHGDQMVTVPWSRNGDAPEYMWVHDDVTDDGEYPADEVAADLAAGLPRSPHIRAALRRHAWLWCATAVAGLVIGAGLYHVHPPPYKAATTVLITNDPNEDPGSAALDAVAIAESRTVAALALNKLGLSESPASFAAGYTVATVTSRVLLITVSAPSSSAAVVRANAVAAAFLQVRADQLMAEEQHTLGTLDQQITQAEQSAASIASQIASVSAQPSSPAQQARLSLLEAESNQAKSALIGMQQAATGYQVTTQATIASIVKGSQVLDPAVPLPQSKVKGPALYLVGGLIGGLALGMGLVTVQALVSGRLRRREDIALALGAPISVSVGHVRALGRLRGRRRLKAARGRQAREIQRIVAHLRGAVPGPSRGAAALAVVAVDNARVTAVPLLSLAVSCAREGKQVVVADLADGAPAARLLRVRRPGVRTVKVNGAQLVVAVPDRRDLMPVGPLPRDAASQSAPCSEALGGAYASADLLLSLVTLDPALGADHLATWASAAVAVVTAGRSSVTRIHAVGAMVRLSGIPLVSAVLVGTDKADESLGVTEASAHRGGDVVDAAAATEANSAALRVD